MTFNIRMATCFRLLDGKGAVHEGVCSGWLNRCEIGEVIPCIIRMYVSSHSSICYSYLCYGLSIDRLQVMVIYEYVYAYTTVLVILF